MVHRPSIASWPFIAVLAIVLALGACGGPELEDPLALPTPFTFEVDNPEEIEGPVYGAMIVPFEGDAWFGLAVGTAAAPPLNLDAFLNAIEDGELDEDGLVTGSFIPTYDVPRINELLGLEFGWPAFFPPEGCDVTATNPVEAAIAPILGIVLWDGETVDEEGYPVVAGVLDLYQQTYEEDGDTRIWAYEYYVAAASRAAWSATTNGACEPEDSWLDELDIDLQIAAGWQFLHVTYTEVCDLDWNCWDSYTARSLTLAQIAAAGPIGTVETDIMFGARSGRPTSAPLAPIFR